jgi:hypothetical protein
MDLWKLEDGHVEVVAGSGLAPNWIKSNYKIISRYYIILGYILKFFIGFYNI